MRKTIVITEKQVNRLEDIFNDPLLKDVGQTFSIDDLKSIKWKNGEEIIRYCESCNLLKLGQGQGRVVFQIDDEKVLKIQRSSYSLTKQNQGEIDAFRQCDKDMQQFIPYIYDWDKDNIYALWIISEQVLPASYADFQKILGIDFGNYTSSADITQMKQDLKDYSQYNGETVNKFSINLMDFLEAYGEVDIKPYIDIIKNNKWFNELYKLLSNGIVTYWELENIENWGLVKRNGKPKIIILDIGI